MSLQELAIGQPIHALQHFLREIATYYSSIPTVVPDGIFGEQTKESVKAFQRLFKLTPNGEVDYEAWVKIVEIYNYIVDSKNLPGRAFIYPHPLYIVNIGDTSEHLLIIQGMLYNISQKFSNITPPYMTGKHDELSTQAIKDIQKIIGSNTNGVIDKNTWNMIAKIYEMYVTNNRVDE